MNFGKNKEDLWNELKALDKATGIDAFVCQGQNVSIEIDGIESPFFNGRKNESKGTNVQGKPLVIKAHISSMNIDDTTDTTDAQDDADGEKMVIKNWTISKKGVQDIMKKIINHGRGSNRTKLYEALEGHRINASMDENLVVLCYSGCETKVSDDDKITTHWIVVNPSVPFEMVNGFPSFPMLELNLTKDEFMLCMESRMALYSEMSEDIYPIRETAFSSIGKLLDATASFKNITAIPLGSALLLADKISVDLKNLKLIYRNGEGHFKPLIGVAGSRFAPYSEEQFFKKLISWMDCKFGGVCIKHWQIYDDVSVVDAELASCKISRNGQDRQQSASEMLCEAMSLYTECADEFKIRLRMKTSDVPGVSASVTAYAKFGDAEVQIHKNSAYHWDSFVRQGEGILNLLTPSKKGSVPIDENIAEFIKKVNSLKKKEVYFNKATDGINDIINQIGKRRIADADAVISRIRDGVSETESKVNAYELFRKTLEETFTKLPAKQSDELMIKYSEFFHSLCKM